MNTYPVNLAARAMHLKELMDDPACDPQKLSRTLQRFGVVNRLVSSWDSVYRSHLRPLLQRHGPARLLDVGCGGGDVLRRTVRLARKDGFEVEALGIDPDRRAFEVAINGEPIDGVSFRQASSSVLVNEGARFDVVISNHLLHHLDETDFDTVIGDSEQLATRLCLHSDIARGRLAYAMFAAAAAPLFPGTFIYVDGLRSIRRSYTMNELASRLPTGWHVEKPGSFRLLAVHKL